jgi:hypothetical protein
VAWSLHLLQRRYRTPRTISSSWSELCIYTSLFVGACLVLFWFARRQYLEFVRQSAVSALGRAVASSHNYDGIATEALRFVQEVEVVSRGYDMWVWVRSCSPGSFADSITVATRCLQSAGWRRWSYPEAVVNYETSLDML